ncbi:Uncharacterized protein MLTONO_0484 [Mesorhizobium loti]|nr:Uncharacterized protein MLTONO_0484 [Mesorhizobium loti]
MKTILVAAAFLASAGGAIAGSDHYGSSIEPWSPATTTDAANTASTKKTDDNAGMQQAVRKPIAPPEQYGQGIWGH